MRYRERRQPRWCEWNRDRVIHIKPCYSSQTLACRRRHGEVGRKFSPLLILSATRPSMQCENNAIRPEPDQTTGGEVILDTHELAQEQLYVAARIGRIDRERFADGARRLERDHGECNYLSWLIRRHPEIPSDTTVDPPPDIGGRELRRARVTWQAKALAKANAKRRARLFKAI